MSRVKKTTYKPQRCHCRALIDGDTVVYTAGWFHLCTKYFDAKHFFFFQDASQGTKLSHQPSEERAAQPWRNVRSLLYLQRKQSNISALQNDEWVTGDHTKPDNHAPWRRQIARRKRTDAVMTERHVGGKICGFHFSSLAILALPPTTFHQTKWTLGGERRLPLTHPSTVRNFLGD